MNVAPPTGLRNSRHRRVVNSGSGKVGRNNVDGCRRKEIRLLPVGVEENCLSVGESIRFAAFQGVVHR